MTAIEQERRIENAIEDLEELAEDNWDEKQSTAARLVLDELDRLYKVERAARELLRQQPTRDLMMPLQIEAAEKLAALIVRPPLSVGPWKYGDMHECPMFGSRHQAGTDCVTYALKRGDQLYVSP